ncbi:hypothetical protein C7212DRAFT_112171, partial [Tuber magnatum]
LQPSTCLNNYSQACYKHTKKEYHYIVSYILFLSRLLDLYINIDICFTVNIFIYLNKYLFKGTDQTVFNIISNEFHNEIADYIDAQYLSDSKAVGQIVEYNISRKILLVKVLSIH